uniref:ShKT domain-containing protein n=1 Tax=Meloidogyne incognita TaxID=6306 RepID=A0A914N0T3_MELIC
MYEFGIFININQNNHNKTSLSSRRPHNKINGHQTKTSIKHGNIGGVCNYLFHEVDKRNGRRDVKCNLQGLEDIAESCRKTCGICCEDINYACEDDKNGIIDCSRQMEKCHQKKWFGVLSRFCAGSCGLCAMTSCRDYDNSCRVRKSLCLKTDSVDYMRENCARTCGFCVVGEENEINNGNERLPENNGKPVVVERPLSQHRLTVPDCSDKVGNCTTNAHLCGSPVYGEYMIKFCTKTCLKCDKAKVNKKEKTKIINEMSPQNPLQVVIQPLVESQEKDRKRIERECEDKNEKCQQWKKAGLCNKIGPPKEVDSLNYYLDDSPQQYNKICPKSCGICC